MADIAKIIEEVKSMTVLELNDLVKALEEEFGVSAAAPVAVAAAPAAAAAAPAEEQTEFKVVIKEIGDKKIDVIKAVREFTTLGLGEAKALVEAKGVIKENATKEEADKIIARFKEAGATVVAELKRPKFFVLFCFALKNCNFYIIRARFYKNFF